MANAKQAPRPQWQHPANTRAGRVERAKWVLRDNERQGYPVTVALAFLASKCSDEEITEALLTVGGGFDVFYDSRSTGSEGYH